jgi:hydrogenase/urease accessory protein HupE
VALGVIVALVPIGATVGAHEIGTTRVSALVRASGTYEIAIVTDASSLAEKLEASAGRPAPPADASADHLQSLLSHSDDAFRRRVTLAFDAPTGPPAIVYSVAPGSDTSAAAATITLTGEIPAGARSFTWSYAWTFASYALTVRAAATDNPAAEWLEGGERSKPFAIASLAAPVGRLPTARRYFVLGFTHILPLGLDHLLFVLGIYLLSGRVRSVLWQVSAFTVAHSITLGLSMFGLLSVSPRIVEPMIALSIAYVAIENLLLSELRLWRVALVFAFGLLHGMGFAGALKELGPPRAELVTALITFNVGVEAAQVAVIGGAFLLLGWHFADRVWYRARIVVPASALIACTAVYWTIERLAL